MKNSWIQFLTFTFLIFSCGTNQVISPKNFKGSRIIFSHGGGFAGTYKSYCLLENGQLFKGNKQYEAEQETKSLDKNVTKQIFSNYEVLGFGEQKVESYGNLNYAIMMINEDGEQHKLIWGKDQKGAEQLQLFYNNMMNQIRLNTTDKDGNTILDESKN